MTINEQKEYNSIDMYTYKIVRDGRMVYSLQFKEEERWE